MSPIEEIENELKSEFLNVQTVVRKSDDPNGMQFLNVYSGDLEIAVEWKPDCGIGVSSFHSNAHELEGAFDSPDEWYSSPRAAFYRIGSLLIDEQTTKVTTMCLGSIRREHGISQNKLSAALDVTQATYSKLERRADMKVSSLRKAIEAMGGVLRIEARFPDSQDVRELTFQ